MDDVKYFKLNIYKIDNYSNSSRIFNLQKELRQISRL